ncbi:MAG: TlpA family protein disulfide reductase [Anaerolineales bacterium]|nr:TlpA family protein disulfide reductase [Anaerolineales bacterium]
MPAAAKRSSAFLVGIAIGVFLLGAAVIVPLTVAREEALASRDRSMVPAAATYPAPDLTLFNLQGDPVALSDYRGLVVLVNNWATWCPPCRAEMPDLLAYYEAHAEEGFVVVAIDAGETEADVRAFVGQYQLTFPVWLDPAMDALVAFQNPNLPNSYVIDREGTVRLTWTGPINRTVLERYVTPLLER